MEYSSVTRVTLVLLLLLGVQSVSAGSCETSYEILVGFSNRSEAIISNSSFTVRPRDGNGQAMQIADARLALWGFQEATRWGDVKCIESDSFPDIPPKWQAHLFKAIQLADMNCTVKRYHELAPGTNVNIATINFQATTSLYPDLVISYNLSTASKAGNYTFYDPFERIAQFETDESFKFTISVDNWPWTEETNTSYLVAAFEAELHTSSAGTLKSDLVGDKLVTVAKLEDGLEITQSFDQNFYLDGDQYIHQFPPTLVFPPVEVPANFTYKKLSSWAFCEYRPPMRQYRTAFYDPSISVLFNLGDDSDDKSAPKSKTDRATWIAAIVVPIVIVAAVAGIILFLVFRPKHDPLAPLKKSHLEA